MKRYRKRPVEIEAAQYLGTNVEEIQEWVGEAPEGGKAFGVFRAGPRLWVDANQSWLPIEEGEWIANDRHGFYPIKNDVFTESYDPVETPTEVCTLVGCHTPAAPEKPIPMCDEHWDEYKAWQKDHVIV